MKSLEQSISLADIIEYVRPFWLVSGQFKSDKSDDTTGSVSNTLSVLHLLSEFVENDTDKSFVKDFVDRAAKLLPEGEDESAVESVLLGYITGLLDKKPKLSSLRLRVISDILLQQIYSNKLSTVSDALISLESMKLFKVAPVSVVLDKSSFEFNQQNKIIHVAVTDVTGDPALVVSLDVKSLKRSHYEEESRFQGSLVDGVLDLSALTLPLGRYDLELIINIEDRSASISVTKHFAITDQLQISEILSGVTTSKLTPIGDLTSVHSQRGLQEVEGSALDSEVFHLAFTLSLKSAYKFVKPHQVFIRFNHLETNTDTYFFAKAIRPVTAADSNSGYLYKAVISLSDEIETFLYLSGDYNVYVIVGDVSYLPLQHSLGVATLKFPEKPSNELPLYGRSLLHTSDNTLVALPEISHKMREPDKRASVATSSLFSIFVALPLLALIAFIISHTSNLKHFNSVINVLFISLVAGVLLLYLGYWFSFNGFSFYQTIRYMFFLLPVTYAVGRVALLNIGEERAKDVKKTI